MTQEQKEQVKKRDKFCQICGATDRLTVDHIIPIAEGGTDDLDNLTTLCKTCNSRKGAIPPFGQRIKNLFNGNLYWFKAEMRQNYNSLWSYYEQLKKDLASQLGQKFKDINSRLGSIDAVDKQIMGRLETQDFKIRQLQAENFVFQERIRGFEKYHRLEWIEEEKKGYKKISKKK